MKVVYFNYLYDIKESSVGAAVHVEELVNALRKCGHQVQVYYLNRFTSVEASTKSKVRGFLKRKLSRYLNQINAFIANRRYFVKEWRIIFQERPDVILVRYNFLSFSLALIASLKKIPFVLEVNAPMAYESKRFSGHVIRLSFICKVLEKLNLKLASKVLVVSQELKDFYLKWRIPGDKIVVVPNGADEKKFHPDIAADKVVAKYELQNKTVIGFVGSFHYWHGVDNLLKFIKTVQAKYSDVVFLLVGCGPLKEKLEQVLKSEQNGNRVIFPGHVSHEEMPEYLAAMDVVVALYPKLEFFYYSPLKLFEYLAAGKTVIASRIGQIKDIIQDGVNGILFEPDNFDELLQKSFLVLNDPKLRKTIGKNGRKLLEEKFTWHHAAKTISEVLESVNSVN
ncbi:glycosyltransferase family 4 protein [bacterium]|nr:glycosyltransferase family 4 protein [bacterium]